MLDNFYTQTLYSRYHRADLLRTAEHDRLAASVLAVRPVRRLRLRPLVQRLLAAVSQRESRRAPTFANACCPTSAAL